MMIRMYPIPLRTENDARPMETDQTSHGHPDGDGVLKKAVAFFENQTLHAKSFGGLESLFSPDSLWRIACGFTVGQVDEQNLQSCRDKLDGSSAHGDLKIVRMGRNCDYIESHCLVILPRARAAPFIRLIGETRSNRRN
jgi:hypothetical protein